MKKKRELFSLILIYMTLAIALFVIGAWLTRSYSLVTLLPGLSPMRANTAFAFLMLSSSFLALRHGLSRLARVMTVLALIVGVLSIIEHVTGVPTVSLTRLIPDTISSGTAGLPGQMSLPTATCVTLLSLGLLSLGTKYFKYGQRAAIVSLVISLSVLISYPYGIASRGSITSYTGMALHTALLATAMAIVLLLTLPYSRWLAMFLSNDFVDVRDRRLLLAAFSLPLVGGWIILYLSASGIIAQGFAQALDVGIIMLVMILLLDYLGTRASRDPLTHLFNRGYFEESLAHALVQATQTQRQGALLFIDLDNFKALNDGLGHAAGDALLKRIVETVQPVLRKTDVFARLGGDEFVIILPDINRAAVQVVAQRILDRLSDLETSLEADVRVTASIGIAMFPDRSRDADTLMRLADDAMYQVKNSGRHGIAFAGEPLELPENSG